MMVSDSKSELDSKFNAFSHHIALPSSSNLPTSSTSPQPVFVTSAMPFSELETPNASHNTNPFISDDFLTPPVSPLTEKLLVLSGNSPASPQEMIQRYSLNLEDLQNRGRYSQSIRSRTRKQVVSNDVSSLFSYNSDICSLKPNRDPTAFPSLPNPSTDLKFPSTEIIKTTESFSEKHDFETPQDSEPFIDSTLGTSSSLQIFSEPESEDLLPVKKERTDPRKSTRRSSRRFSTRVRSSVGGERPTNTVLPSYATLTLKDDQGANNAQEVTRPVMKRNQTIFESSIHRKSSLKRTAHNRSYSLAVTNAKKNNAYEQVSSWEEAKSSWKQLRWASKKTPKKNQPEDDDEKVLIGTRVSEGHVNYALMYNMLTGIRVSVSRCSAKSMVSLSNADFLAAKKLAFDITGNELVPSSKYDFKFKDYAPDVFRQIRAIFGLDPAEYLMSLTHKYIVSELFSPGKSKSFFYYSRDYRFIIKTVHHVEHRFMRKILPRYFQYIKENPNTLLTRIYGLHRVKIPYSSKIHFVVMANLFSPDKDIHESYDLKGSTLGRKVDEEALGPNSLIPMKDLNWLDKDRKFQLGPEKQKIFLEQLEKDAKLLSSLKIMDYSLLVGIHNVSQGQDQRQLDRTLSVIQPKNLHSKNAPSELKDSSFQRTCAIDSNISETSIINSDNGQPIVNNSCFYREQGGFFSSNEDNEPGDVIYYMGIIDILTPYNYAKKIEHRWKSLKYDKNIISAVHPKNYAKRFLDFLTNSLVLNDPYESYVLSESKENIVKKSLRRPTTRRQSMRIKKTQ